MGYSIKFWAKKKVDQEKTLLDLTRAAYRCGFSFSLHKVEKKIMVDNDFLGIVEVFAKF